MFYKILNEKIEINVTLSIMKFSMIWVRKKNA